jgi:hypothetical protein
MCRQGYKKSSCVVTPIRLQKNTHHVGHSTPTNQFAGLLWLVGACHTQANQTTFVHASCYMPADQA